MHGHAPMDRPALLAALRARIARLERGAALAQGPRGIVPLGAGPDSHLPEGGLERAAIHDILAAEPGAAAGFCALLLGRAGGPVLWISPAPEAWAPGLKRFGLQPADLILVRAAAADALWAMEEALRCPAVGAVLLECRGLPPNATRRLQLAAEAGGGLGLLLREDAAALPATRTRWRVDAAPSEASAPHDLGDPRWQIELLRARAAPPAAWLATWREAAGVLDTERVALPEAAPRPAATRPDRLAAAGRKALP